MQLSSQWQMGAVAPATLLAEKVVKEQFKLQNQTHRSSIVALTLLQLLEVRNCDRSGRGQEKACCGEESHGGSTTFFLRLGLREAPLVAENTSDGRNAMQCKSNLRSFFFRHVL